VGSSKLGKGGFSSGVGGGKGKNRKKKSYTVGGKVNVGGSGPDRGNMKR